MRLLSLCLLPLLLSAAVSKVHLVERGDVLDGRAFGSAGPYERVYARAYFNVDPALSANRIVRDLDKAKRNEAGLVSFSADVFVLKPRDPALGNGTILFEVSNRGGKGLSGMFQSSTAALAHQGPAANDPKAYGDQWLLAQGYTLVWVGWQWDVPVGDALLRVYPPVAEGVEAMIRSEFLPLSRTKEMSLGDRNMQPYAAAATPTLTVRDTPTGRRQTIGTGWRLNDAKTGIVMESGFAPWQIYEAIYPTRNPAVAGAGLAAIRDFISFLRYENAGTVLLGDQRRYLKRALAFGTSQSGRLLRQFVYDGFNQDEKGRPVFDGIWANVAGAGRGSFNIRGAQPSRDGHPTFNFFYPSDIFPFSDLTQTDSETGQSDGILANVKQAPKIFYTNGSYEYWGRNAALIHVTPDGRQDAAIPDTTRIYYVASSQHGPGRMPPLREGLVNYSNANDYRPLYRALLVALEAWVKDNVAPPPSAYPRLDRHELIPYERFPHPSKPRQIARAYRVDYSGEPPRLGKAFPALVPALDATGNEVGGIRMPEIAVPLATYTGWNFRAGQDVPPGWFNDMVGSTIPYAPAAIRRAHATRESYQEKVRAAAQELVQRRLLLPNDVDAVVARAGRSYDWLLSSR